MNVGDDNLLEAHPLGWMIDINERGLKGNTVVCSNGGSFKCPVPRIHVTFFHGLGIGSDSNCSTTFMYRFRVSV
jgi:hypothetical protein